MSQNLAERISSKETAIEELEAQIEDAKSRLEGHREDAMEELEDALDLAKDILKKCRDVYLKWMARHEMQSVLFNFKAYYKQIHEPMQGFVSLTDQLKQAYSHARQQLPAPGNSAK